MKQTFYELVHFLKTPVLVKDTNINLSYRFKKLFHLFIISIITAVILTPILSLIGETGLVNMDEHAMEELLNSMSKLTVFFLAVIIAPLFEELVFRAPLSLFKKPKTFKIIFYVFAITFGLVHITNFKLTTNVILLAPFLVAPQIILGTYLGFIRIRFGLLWSILLHATYNAFFMLITFASDLS